MSCLLAEGDPPTADETHAKHRAGKQPNGDLSATNSGFHFRSYPLLHMQQNQLQLEVILTDPH
jgi:hypothetical protein